MTIGKIGRFQAILAAAALCFSGTAFGQSCAMCYASAAASGEAGAKALRHGILILLFPPLLMFVAICVAAFRRRRRDEFSQTTWADVPALQSGLLEPVRHPAERNVRR